MSKSNTFENDCLKLVFNGTAIANIADNAASSPLTNLYLSLHTADPGEAGVQTTNECAYTAYPRQATSFSRFARAASRPRHLLPSERRSAEPVKFSTAEQYPQIS